MREVRRRFHEELRALEDEVQRTGVQAQLLLEKALQALTRRDLAVCDAVIEGDDEVDELYLDVERRILGLFALQTPVASDLRLLTALLHINLHLERIADQAVNLAKITKLTDVWGAETRIRAVSRDSVPSADAVRVLVDRPSVCRPAGPPRLW
jgi:phosphate transport system protein